MLIELAIDVVAGVVRLLRVFGVEQNAWAAIIVSRSGYPIRDRRLDSGLMIALAINVVAGVFGYYGALVGTECLGRPLSLHEAATPPATIAWNWTDDRACHQCRRRRVRLLRAFGLAVLFRLMQNPPRKPAGSSSGNSICGGSLLKRFGLSGRNEAEDNPGNETST